MNMPPDQPSGAPSPNAADAGVTPRPRARRFNIVVGAPQDTDTGATTRAPLPGPNSAAAADVEDGFGPLPFLRAAGGSGAAAPAAAGDAGAGTPAPDAPVSTAERAAIAAENVAPQQLRLARRLAQKRGFAAQDDAEAVVRLRRAGIDPFGREAILALNDPAPTAPPAGTSGQGAAVGAQVGGAAVLGGLPVRRPDPPGPPATAAPVPQNAAAEVLTMQRDIVRRRRIRSMLLMLRLLFFVGLPTTLAGYYYAVVATPIFASNTEMLIQMAEPTTPGGGGLLGGSAIATVQDSVAMQGYLESREAMLRLDAEHGFRAAFSDPMMDPIQRLAPEASIEETYKSYRKQVRISFDPTEGLIRMEVRAPSATLAADWSAALIRYAEEQVDNLSRRLRDDQMSGARASYDAAEAAMRAAQDRVITLQERYDVMSGDAEASLITQRISALEQQLLDDRIGLEELRANTTPNQARIAPILRRITVLEAEIARLRARLTGAVAGPDGAGGMSLARVQGELMVAQSDMDMRKALLGEALRQMEAARVEANRQVRYLSVSVSPLVADQAVYPRAVENTAVAGLILLGVYLMLALTTAVLREQVAG